MVCYVVCRHPRQSAHAHLSESLVHDLSIPIQGSFDEDLGQLQSDDILKPNIPAYILAKVDLPSSDWISFYYVPDNARVREKV